MAKSATDGMQEIIFSALIDSIMALKAASKGLPNTLLRDLNAVHANTTFSDLPKELQATIRAVCELRDSQLVRVLIQPAGWEEVSMDDESLFAGFARSGDFGG